MRVSFGEFLVDSAERQLLRAEAQVHVTAKAFQLLILLISERPRVLSKKEIYDTLWPNVYVQEANIKNLVAELRSVLGEGAEQLIRTERGVGYAFVGEAQDELTLSQPRFLLVVNGVAFALRDGRNVIGRDPTAHVKLDSASASRSHASVTVTGDDASLQDLGSRNGTYLNGEKIETARSLRAGDEIRIAGFAIRFQTAPGSARATAPLGLRV